MTERDGVYTYNHTTVRYCGTPLVRRETNVFIYALHYGNMSLLCVRVRFDSCESESVPDANFEIIFPYRYVTTARVRERVKKQQLSATVFEVSFTLTTPWKSSGHKYNKYIIIFLPHSSVSFRRRFFLGFSTF